MAESKEELKNLMMTVKEESETVGLKVNIQKTKIKTVETVSDFIFLGSKTTPGGAWNHCNYKIKRRLLLGRKAMTNLESILKSRAITLPTKVCLIKAMAFPVVMYGYESWTIKKAEH